MNKQMKQHLEAVVDAIVESDSAAAKEAFHQYLRLKTQSILLGESVESEETCDEEDCTDDEKDEDDKKSKKPKKSKKADDESGDEDDKM
jgi:hypothetical protein